MEGYKFYDEGGKKMIKKAYVIGIVIVFLVGSFASGITINRESVQHSSRGTLYVGGNGTGNYSAIQDAINATTAASITVLDGEYYEELEIKEKTIDLKGEEEKYPLITGTLKLEKSDMSKITDLSFYYEDEDDDWAEKNSIQGWLYGGSVYSWQKRYGKDRLLYPVHYRCADGPGRTTADPAGPRTGELPGGAFDSK